MARNPIQGAEDRLPLSQIQKMDCAQIAAVDRIVAGPRGELNGPFVPLLRSPELMTRLQLVGDYLRFESHISPDLFEFVILTVARRWTQQFEWGFHHPIARREGVPDSVIKAVEQGKRPDTGREEFRAIWDLVSEIHTRQQVSDDVYKAITEALGEVQVVELLGTIGYYTTLAITMNVAQTPPPEGAPRLPELGETIGC